jgi:hypothetical protein
MNGSPALTALLLVTLIGCTGQPLSSEGISSALSAAQDAALEASSDAEVTSTKARLKEVYSQVFRLADRGDPNACAWASTITVGKALAIEESLKVGSATDSDKREYVDLLKSTRMYLECAARDIAAVDEVIRSDTADSAASFPEAEAQRLRVFRLDTR